MYEGQCFSEFDVVVFSTPYAPIYVLENPCPQWRAVFAFRQMVFQKDFIPTDLKSPIKPTYGRIRDEGIGLEQSNGYESDDRFASVR